MKLKKWEQEILGSLTRNQLASGMHTVKWK